MLIVSNLALSGAKIINNSENIIGLYSFFFTLFCFFQPFMVGKRFNLCNFVAENKNDIYYAVEI